MGDQARILMVDDEPNVLAGYRRSIGRTFEVVIAEGGAEALCVMEADGPFPVIVTDMRMPGMNGIEFVREARKRDRDAVFAMLTGNADQQTAIDAINEGQIFRFLNKPCPPEKLEQAIRACIDQHRLIRAEKDLLRDTVTGSIRLLVETVSLADPALGQLGSAVRRDAKALGDALHASSDWRMPIASSLCLLGVMVTGGPSDPAKVTEESLAQAAAAGARLLQHIPRLAGVAEMLARHRDAGPMPQNLRTEDPAERTLIGARILRFAVDHQLALRRHANDHAAALRWMRHAEPCYDPRLMEVAARVLTPAAPAGAVRSVRLPVKKLSADMIIDQDVLTKDGVVLLTRGVVLSDVHIERLLAFSRLGKVEQEVAVLADPATHPAAREAA